MENVEIGLPEVHKPLCVETRKVPELDKLPRVIDALIVPGMGPVRPALVGSEEERRVVAESQLMRHNTIAAAELAAHGALGEKGVVITSGKATAKKPDTQKALLDRTRYSEHLGYDEQLAVAESGISEEDLIEYQTANIHPKTSKDLSQEEIRVINREPKSKTELGIVNQTTEAGLMSDLVTRVVPKSGERKPITAERVVEEPLAPNSIKNLLEAINVLDATIQGDGIWTGNLGIVTSEFGHLARNKEILNAIGFTDDKLVPLDAQEVLQQSGYGELYSEHWKQQMESYKGGQERWRRGVRERPVYLITQLDAVQKPARLYQMMRGLRQWYGQETLIKYGLGDFENMTPEQIKKQATAFDREAPENLPPNDWSPGDLNAQEQEIQQYKVLTEQWLQRI